MKRVLSIFILLFGINIYSQTDPAWFSEYKTITPAKHYEAGWFHELFFGAHWRDLWTTPVKVGVIDLNKFGGGLTPTEKGGGLQTKALKFKGADGKEYKFRSLDKDPRKTLPKELQESIAKDIIQDQISSSNPYAGFVVNEILDSVGVYHSEYTLVIIPDDPKLGEYQKEFAGLLGLMEIVPDEEQFEGSDKVVGTVKLLDRFNKEYDESVDGKAFLKARLIDIFLGDWDRHKDQWKWIRYEDGDRKIYKPFPMDRDQAFAKFDGLLPWIAEQNLPQLNNFGEDYPNMRYMTWSGRYLDQRFLEFLTKLEWDAETDEVLAKLTNETIESAVKKLPPEVYAKAKDELTEKLKSRRNQLKEASNEYYEHVNKVVDIYTTDKDDYVRIGFNPVTGIDYKDMEDFTMITIFKKDQDSGKSMEGVLKQKRFDNNITDEIRIYVQDGDDEVVIGGKGDDVPKIRIIGGDGKDRVINKSKETVLFYDDGKKTYTEGDVSFDGDKYKLPYEKPLKEFKKKKDNLSKQEKDKYEDLIGNLRYDVPPPPDKFQFTSFFPVFNYTPDTGPFFGGTYTYMRYGFRMNPYLYKLNFMAGYAPAKKDITGLVVDLNFDFLGIIKKSSVNFHARKSGIQVNNYFGQGNNTVYRKSAEDSGNYKLKNEEYLFNPTVTFRNNKHLKFSVGVKYKKFDVIHDKDDDTANVLYPDVQTNMIGFTAGVELDKRDHPTSPFSGYYFNLTGGYFPSFLDKLYDFVKISADLRAYIGYKQNASLAFRLWGEKVYNDYPFFESAFLGGSKLLRGFPSERFAGDGSVLASIEGRLKLFKMNFLLPETIGIFCFGETGRVFVNGEKSDTWHTGYGGGLFMFLINRDITFKLTYARSIEKDISLYFGTGFGF
jgi:hypothetical protein